MPFLSSSQGSDLHHHLGAFPVASGSLPVFSNKSLACLISSCGFVSQRIQITHLLPKCKKVYYLHSFFFFCIAKETKNKMKRQPSEWKKIFASEATDNGLISKIYKQLMQLLKKAMASYSSTLAWKIPRTEEPGKL